MLLYLTDPSKKSSITEVWNEVFPPSLYEVLTDDDLNLLAKVCLGYVLNVLPWPSSFRALSSINAKIASICEDTPFNTYKDLRHKLIQKGNTALGVKLFILRMLVKEMEGEDIEIDKERRWCEVYENDKALWYNLDEIGWKSTLKAVIEQSPEFEVPVPKQVKKDCEEFMIKSEEFIRRTTIRYLKFIYTSNNMKHDDLMGDLQAYAIEAYYLKTPFIPKAHVENTARRAIVNGKNKIIEYYTSPDRARLYKENGDYVNRIVTESRVGYQTGHKVYSSADETVLDTKEIDRVDTAIMLEKMRKEKRDVLSLLSFEDNADFIDYCSCIYGKASSCEEIFDKVGVAKYYGAIASYLKISKDAFKRIVMEIRLTLQDNVEALKAA